MSQLFSNKLFKERKESNIFEKFIVSFFTLFTAFMYLKGFKLSILKHQLVRLSNSYTLYCKRVVHWTFLKRFSWWNLSILWILGLFESMKLIAIHYSILELYIPYLSALLSEQRTADMMGSLWIFLFMTWAYKIYSKFCQELN